MWHSRFPAWQKSSSRLRFALLTGIVLSSAFGLLSEAVRSALARQNQPSSAPLDQGYVGSKSCAHCHRDIYEEFSRTDMGRSMSYPAPRTLAALGNSAAITDISPNRHLEVFAREEKLYQSEYELDSEGKDVFRDTHALSWLIGSGANGFGAISQVGNYLVQAPLSFYSKPRRWALSPGYESGDYGFTRPILPGCIVCHSGRPRLVAAGDGRFEDPPFSELAIGCENCHGPGITHVTTMEVYPDYEGHDPAIVNPARLEPELADNICMYCHQMGDARILQPGRSYQDFRPGTPLDNTLAILLVPPKPESPPQSDLLEHDYSMRLSKCYRASGGRLSCISCHDPHVQPSPEEAPAYFAKRCLTCHTDKSCRLPLEVRQDQNPPDDCAGCHMPKRDVGIISHSSLTNHRIVSEPNEPLPSAAFHQTTEALPDLIHLDPAPGRKDTPLPALTLLQAYGELMDQKPEYAPRYSALLSELARTKPDSGLVQAALGRKELRAGRYQEAATHLERVSQLGPPQAAAYADLAEAMVKLNRPEESVRLLLMATQLEPFNSTLRKTLVLHLIQLKRYPEAESAMEEYVKSFPEDSFMRHMLTQAQRAGASK